MKTKLYAALLGAALVLGAVTASAHVGVTSPATANATQEIFFSVGHGCAGADTSAVTVDIPAGVTSVRTQRSDFSNATITRDVAGNVTTVTWKKPDSELLPEDTAYYKLGLRLKLPNAPFTTIAFPTHQTCTASDGGVSVVDWVATSSALPDGGEAEPAPTVTLLPARKAGWNKYTVPAAISDLNAYFADARIVWAGNAAWSSNPNTTAQISQTPGVTALTSLKANEEIWVSY